MSNASQWEKTQGYIHAQIESWTDLQFKLSYQGTDFYTIEETYSKVATKLLVENCGKTP